MAINSLFKKDIVSDGGKLMAKQRRFAYSSLVPILMYMGLFTLFPILFAMTMSFFSYSPIRDGVDSLRGTLIQAHTTYPNHIFYEDGDGLILSQYIPCQLNWHKNGIRVKLTLSEDTQPKAYRKPHYRSYLLQITCDQPQEFTIQFRLPWWMSASPKVEVNGAEQAVIGNPSTYARIHQVWHTDTVQITLPQELTICTLARFAGYGCFHGGSSCSCGCS